MNEPPPDRPQEDEPPDLDLLLPVVRQLLNDLDTHFDPGSDEHLRIQAVRTVVKDVIERRRA